jgi:hypothetical protein
VGTKVLTFATGRARKIVLVGLLAALCAAAPGFVAATVARAGIGSTALADCNANDRLTHTYTAAELSNALATMPATVREYTDCQQVIGAALIVAERNGHSNGTGSDSSSGGSFLPTPVIVVLVLLALAAATLGALAIRRRRGPPGGTGAGPQAGAGP